MPITRLMIGALAAAVLTAAVCWVIARRRVTVAAAQAYENGTLDAMAERIDVRQAEQRLDDVWQAAYSAGWADGVADQATATATDPIKAPFAAPLQGVGKHTSYAQLAPFPDGLASQVTDWAKGMLADIATWRHLP